jgi:GAF domain-containing protein
VPYLLLLAALKIAGALVLWGAAQARAPVAYPHPFPPWYHLLFLAAFAGTGAALLWAARTDRRARAFGVVLVSFGTIFADPLLRHALLTADGLQAGIGRLLYAMQVVAFTPTALWLFASVFPARQPRRIGWLRPLGFARVSAGVGAAALIVNMADAIVGQRVPGPLLTWLRVSRDGGLWAVLSLLALPAFVFLMLKGWRAAPRERRHAFRFLAGLAVGMLPLGIDVLLNSAVPAYVEATRSAARGRAIGMIVSGALLLVPPLTAYAVAERLFDVRFMIRRVVQYALARYTVIAALSIPTVALAWAIYQRRDERIGDVLTLRSPLVWLLLIALATVLWGRRVLLDTIDRRFFREHYDARRILLTLASGSGHARNLPELATLVSAEVDRALHLQHVGLSIQDPDGAVLRDPQQHLPPLSTDSPLAALLAGSAAPLDVSFEPDSPSALARLPSGDRQWLEDTHAHLLVPLRAPAGSLLGVMTLGHKRSELPFNADDRQLLTAVAASVALVIDRRLLGGSGAEATAERTAADDQPAAQECVRCGRVHPRSAPQCRRCGGDLRDSLLPTHLAGKFAVDRRIGAGGMGVVYKGHDLTLDRAVALKTLPRLSAGEATQLRREARAMASVEHPHLASIYGAESWRGAPVLVLEHLPGGTLADRVQAGVIPIAHIISAGRGIAQALRHLHGIGILHRDVKPSNIGYAAGDVPKLMDFGLAKLTAAQAISPVHDRLSDLSTQPMPLLDPAAALSTGRQFVGTTPYMAPEILHGHRPAEASDLWSLCVSLYEALTRRHPFLREDLTTTVSAITTGLTVDARTIRPDCPLELSVLLSSALSAKAEDRPRNITAFLAALDGVPLS